MPNRNIRDEKQQADDGRPKVGPADPATRKRMLEERLNEREPNIYGKGQSQPSKPARQSTPLERDLSVFSVPRKLRERKQRFEDEASK